MGRRIALRDAVTIKRFLDLAADDKNALDVRRCFNCPIAAVLALTALAGCSRAQVAPAEFATQRERMVKEQIAGRGVSDERVLAAMRSVPRHEFVPERSRQAAYEDQPLPIGEGQTISQPYVVALMTAQLKPEPDHRVLEIGTGSGYQAAVLSGLVADVFTIEIVESLGHAAEATLQRLGYKNVHVKIGDGYKGWPEHAPFDSIIVTCAPDQVPPALVEQLKEGGRMVIPVGPPLAQELYIVQKVNGQLRQTALLDVRFVPMRRPGSGD